MSTSEVKEYLIPDPNKPGELIKEIKKTTTCGCTSRFGRNGNSLKFTTHLDYNNTTFEELASRSLTLKTPEQK